MKRNHKKHRYRSGSIQVPSFDSGVIPEPHLLFGGHHEHVDPKTGISLYGPYCLAGQSSPPLKNIIVGIIGPGDLVADTEQWLHACSGVLTNDGSQPFLYPHFPGFNKNHPFQCELMFGETWREVYTKIELERALAPENFYERIKRVTALYMKGIEILASREPHPNVILCCIPQSIIDLCTVRKTSWGAVKRIKISSSERKALKAVRSGQPFLFPEMDPLLGIEDEESGHENLRRGIKAEAMLYGIPTQLVWPHTLQLSHSSRSEFSGRASQDIATRAWNFMTAIYHKAGGVPWRLAVVEPGACFVGISFYREIHGPSRQLRTSMAQAFTSAGDGYVLRGKSFEWDERQGSPHMDEASAAAIIRDVLDHYEKQNRGAIPSRIVLHKTSRFWDEELAGFYSACNHIPRKDFVALGWRGIQFYRLGDYPPIRCMYVKFNETNFLLYPVGYIPFLRSYPGARTPQPLEVLEHRGDSPWNLVLQEILAFTKMNWNTADFSCGKPVTIAFARRVGQILAELPDDVRPRAEYRFYM